MNQPEFAGFRAPRRRTLARATAALAAATGIAVVSGCSSTGNDSASSDGGLTTVTVALDYVANNPGYAGLYAAVANGYYEEAGLEVVLNGYTSTSSDVLVDSGQADFGTIDQASLILGRAVGEDLVATAALMQSDPQRFVIAPSQAAEVTTPADLEGRVYGGWGLPMEEAINKTAIINDGSTGEYQNVVLSTDAYTALQEDQVDWSIVYETDDILWWTMDGEPVNVIDYRDYGIPDMYGKMLFSSQAFLDAEPEVAQAFMDASLRGYEWAADNPVEAVAIMADMGLGDFDVEDFNATAEMLATDYWTDSSGSIGAMDSQRWAAYAEFLVDAGVVTDANGDVVAEIPDTSTYFTTLYVGSDK